MGKGEEMSRARICLTLAEHRQVGAMLKRARALLLDAAAITRCHDRLSRQLSDAANGLMAQRGELERKLIEAVGADGLRAFTSGTSTSGARK